MAQTARNIDRLSEAMRTLDEMATHEREEIREMLSTQFGNLRKILVELEPEVRGTLRHSSERFSQFATNTTQAAKEKMKDIGQNVDNKVHDAPWTFMGISAIAGILAGYYFANRLPYRRSRLCCG